MKDKFDFRCFKHPSKPVHAVCLNPSCRGYRFFCIQCFLDNTTHLELHSNDILEVGQFIKEVLTLKDKKNKKNNNESATLASNKDVIDYFFENQKNILKIEEKFKECQERMTRYYNKMLSTLQSKIEKHRSVLQTHLESVIMQLRKRLVEQEWKLRTLSAQDENFLKKEQVQEEFELPDWQNQADVERFIEHHLIEDRYNLNPKKQNTVDESSRKTLNFLKELKECLSEQERVDKYLSNALSRDSLKSGFKESEMLVSSVLRRLNENLLLVHGLNKDSKSPLVVKQLASNLPMNEIKGLQPQAIASEICSVSSAESSFHFTQRNYMNEVNDTKRVVGGGISIRLQQQQTSSRKASSHKKSKLNDKKNMMKETMKYTNADRASSHITYNKQPETMPTGLAALFSNANKDRENFKSKMDFDIRPISRAAELLPSKPKNTTNNNNLANALGILSTKNTVNRESSSMFGMGVSRLRNNNADLGFMEMDTHKPEAIVSKKRASSPFKMCLRSDSDIEDTCTDDSPDHVARSRLPTKKQKVGKSDLNESFESSIKLAKHQVPASKNPPQSRQRNQLEKSIGRPVNLSRTLLGNSSTTNNDTSTNSKREKSHGLHLGFNSSVNSILSLVFEKEKLRSEIGQNCDPPMSKAPIKQIPCDIKSLQTDHNEGITSIVFLCDTTIATGSLDATIKLWDTQTFENVKVLYGHKFWVTCLKPIRNIKKHNCNSLAYYDGSWNDYSGMMSFKEEEILLLSGSTDFEIKLWDPFNRDEPLFTFVGHYQMITSMVVLNRMNNANVKYFVSGSKDKKLKVWDFEQKFCVNTTNEHEDGVLALAYEKESDLLASSSLDGTILVWRVQFGDNADFRKLILKSKLRADHNASVYSLTFQDSSRLFAGDSEGTLSLWSTEDDSCLWSKCILDGKIYGIEVAHAEEEGGRDEQRGHVIAVSTKGKVGVVDLAGMERIGQFDGSFKFAEQYPFGEILVTRSEEEGDRGVRILGVSNGSSDILIMQPRLG